jgi:hypothetical protein
MLALNHEVAVGFLIRGQEILIYQEGVRL